MTDPKPGEFKLDFDDPENPRVVTLTIPLGYIADDISNTGYYYMRGWLDELKDKLIGIMLQIRKTKADKNTGIIIPKVH